jgi:hypothetical protein
MPPSAAAQRPVASSGADLVTTFDDEITVERKIEAYLNRNGIKTRSFLVNNTALVISAYFLGANGQPNFEYRITSTPANPTRGVLVALITGVKVYRADGQIQAMINQANSASALAWFIDPKTDELRCQSFIVTPGPESPIPMAILTNVMARMSANWAQVFPELMKTLKSPGTSVTDRPATFFNRENDSDENTPDVLIFY